MFKNRTILVTGCNSAVGRTLIEHLLKCTDYDLIVTTRGSIINRHYFQNPRTRVIDNLDISLSNNALTLSDFVVANIRNSELDIVNCTGYFPRYAKIGELDINEANMIFGSNFITAYNILHYLLPVMAKIGSGKFISFSSHTNYQHYPYSAAFNASKSALEALTLTAANEYSSRGISANIFSLATVDTPAERRLKPNGDFTHWLKLDQIAKHILHFLKMPDNSANGNIFHLFNHSNSFFSQGYLNRISKEEDNG